MKNILFICMGNLCRSPIAQAVATRKAEQRGLTPWVRFASAGTHPSRKGETADPRAIRVGHARGYNLTNHRTRRIDSADFRKFDLILTADADNLAVLKDKCPPEYLPRLGLLLDALNDPALIEIPDPYFGNLEGFERVFDLCEAAIDALFQKHHNFRLP